MTVCVTRSDREGERGREREREGERGRERERECGEKGDRTAVGGTLTQASGSDADD